MRPWASHRLPWQDPQSHGKGRRRPEGRVWGAGSLTVMLACVPAKLQRQCAGHLLLGHNLEVRRVGGSAPASVSLSPCLLALVALGAWPSPAHGLARDTQPPDISLSLCVAASCSAGHPRFTSSRPPLSTDQRRTLRLREQVRDSPGSHVGESPACHGSALGLCRAPTDQAPRAAHGLRRRWCRGRSQTGDADQLSTLLLLGAGHSTVWH